MSPTTALIMAGILVLSGCETDAQRKAAEARTTKQAVQKIDRICALPEGEREVQLKKLEKESGVELFCGK